MRSSPTNLHPAAMLLAAWSTIKSWGGYLAFYAGAQVLFSGIGLARLLVILGAALLFVLGSMVWGYLSWRTTVYWVENNAFHLRRGVVGTNERSIPLEHIQSVDVVQGLLQRLFRVVEVRIETAGGGSTGSSQSADAALPALSREQAVALQTELEARRRAVPVVETDVAEPVGPVLIRKLSVGQLLLAGATSGQIGVALPVIGAASQLFDDFFSEELAMRVSQALPRTVSTVLVLVFVVVLLAWLIAILGTVLSYAGFTLSRDGENLRIRRGLLETREVTIPLKRIQAIRTVEGLLRQPFGLVLLRMDSAGYGKDAGVSATLFPLLPRGQVLAFLQAAVPEFAVDTPLHPLPRRALRRYVIRETLPYLLLAAPLAVGAYLLRARYPEWLVSPVTAGYLGLIVLGALYGWLQFRGTGWAYAADCLVLRTRSLARVTIIAPRRRLQSRSVTQSPFQRRLGLATLGVQVASGGRGATFQGVDMDEGTATDLVEQLGPVVR